MKTLLLAFVFAFTLSKADIEPQHFFEFMVYTENGDSIKGYSTFPVYMYCDSVIKSEKINITREYQSRPQPDTIDFFLKRAQYNLYTKRIGDTSNTQLLYWHCDNFKIAVSNISHVRELKHFSTSPYYVLDAPVLELDSLWNKNDPDTIIILPYDEMFTYHYCIYDFFGENHDFFKKLADYAHECRLELETSFLDLLENEQIEKEKERAERWKELKIMMKEIKTLKKVVVAYSGSC